ncbi:hypothetical protein NEOLEDRAFT_1148886 [Neolentinus lepideus HHB14362 ss-1]|uniref:DUF6532 domain-containing protein n=1 Tax=Neolentinus lepideus HHB14362 ss-1 TaxID=1314782 RepID=A0A165RM88_9AGAM|nr:hypothetical protein NEOLEDRAFT_1148886 [Neolentinus lepideus HHB14362 ss-1]
MTNLSQEYHAPRLASDLEEELASTAAQADWDPHDSASSEDKDIASNDEEHADHKAQVLESDDKHLAGLAPDNLADTLEAENPAWQGDLDETDFDPVLNAPTKYRRKSCSASASLFNSSYVSIPDDDGRSDDEEILEVQSKPHCHSKVSKTATCNASTAAAHLFDNDEHVIDVRRDTHPWHGREHATDAQPPHQGPLKGQNAHEELSRLPPYTSSTVKSKSKRQLAHETETCHSEAKHAATAITDNGMDSDHDADAPSVYDMMALMYNSRGKLNLTAQTEEIQAIVQRAIDIVLTEILTVYSYPDVTDRMTLVRNACVDAADEVRDQYAPILVKLLDKKQKEFMKALSNIACPDARISLTHSEVWDAAVGQVVGHYGLVQGCGNHVTNLLKEQQYIFPGNHHTGSINFKEPYRHPAVLAIAKFIASILSLLAFSSSLKDRDEPEILAAMVALASTVIHAAICKWSSGSVVALDFSGNQFASVYHSHKINLEHICSMMLNFYHETMSYLFCEARGKSNSGLSEDVEQSAISLMDLSGLD